MVLLGFGMFLRHKAAEHGVTVLSVSEAYSTKTVSRTGELLDDVGGTSAIRGSDGERMDRDHNGARGIYLRALGYTPALRESLSARAASVASPQLSGNVSKVT